MGKWVRKVGDDCFMPGVPQKTPLIMWHLSRDLEAVKGEPWGYPVEHSRQREQWVQRPWGLVCPRTSKRLDGWSGVFGDEVRDGTGGLCRPLEEAWLPPSVAGSLCRVLSKTWSDLAYKRIPLSCGKNAAVEGQGWDQIGGHCNNPRVRWWYMAKGVRMVRSGWMLGRSQGHRICCLIRHGVGGEERHQGWRRALAWATGKIDLPFIEARKPRKE